jgi:hypothetical protein
MGVPSIDWEAESYPAHADFAVLPFFVAFFLAVRFLLDRFVFEVVTRTVHDFPRAAQFRIICLLSYAFISY